MKLREINRTAFYQPPQIPNKDLLQHNKHNVLTRTMMEVLSSPLDWRSSFDFAKSLLRGNLSAIYSFGWSSE